MFILGMSQIIADIHFQCLGKVISYFTTDSFKMGNIFDNQKIVLFNLQISFDLVKFVILLK